MTEEKVKELIRKEFEEFLASDRYIFHKHIQLLDGRNIQCGRSIGTKIGTGIDQKIGFYNTAPVAQRASASQAEISLGSVAGSDTVSSSAISTNFGSVQTLLNEIRAVLVALGLMKGSS